LFRKPEGKRPLQRPRCKWEDNITMVLRETGLGGVDWVHLALDRNQWQALVNTIINLLVLAIKGMEFLDLLREY
jgi:hypothetical protein